MYVEIFDDGAFVSTRLAREDRNSLGRPVATGVQLGRPALRTAGESVDLRVSFIFNSICVAYKLQDETNRPTRTT